MNLIGKIVNNKYKIIQKIGEGGMSYVWLADDLTKKENVVIKVLKKGVTSNRVEDIIRFRNEATIVSKLDVPGVAKIFEIGEMENMHYLVMEYVQGKSLYHLIEDGIRFELNDVVEIVCKIGEALKHIHNTNVIHRDLKPGNIMINYAPNTKIAQQEVKLIDFGLAQVKEFYSKNTNEIIGTLIYMAPEQSGFIKRNIDERSDLYSIGVILYQLLTGGLPFTAENLNSLIHQHIAKVPEKLTKFNPSIPKILEKIDLKLLEKEPEKRYQSVEGLLSDLEKFKKGQSDFIPGIDDKFVKLNYRTNLIGREEEIARIKALFDNALKGKGSVCLIGGEAGRGKTRLAEELRNYVYEKNGTFIDGKCFSGKNKTPYGPFKDALNVYVRDFDKKYSDEKLRGRIREVFTNYIGNLGEVILKLNPIMERILGECPPLVELDPEKENKRFLMIASQFFYVLGKIESALVVMIDDLQWTDEGSLELLNEMIKEISNHPLLIVGTYRDNEITEGHGLQFFIENAVASDYPLIDIQLKPFDEKRINKFVANLLFDNEKNAEEISNFVFQKSKGNPFFTIEILKQLVSEKAVIRHEGRWQFNQEILAKIEIPSTIVDTLIKKISLLDNEEINILSYAALIGRKFDIEILFLLGNLGKEEIVKVVDRAVELQLLEGDPYERGKILFLHDRIKEAFYKNIGEKRRKELHRKIAAAIEDTNKHDLEKVVFDLAHHYIEGENKEKALEYAFPAGKKARSNYANEEAVKYFLIVKNLLEEKGERGHAQWIECLEIIGDIYSNFGKVDDAIFLYNELLPFERLRLKKARIYRQLSYDYYKKGDWKNCEKFGKLGLEALGQRLPVGNIKVILSIAKEITIHMLHVAFPVIFVANREKPHNEGAKQIIWLYFVLSSSYSMIGSLKHYYTVLKMINIAESRIGKSKELSLSIMIYALYLAEIPRFKPALKYHKKALELSKELTDEWGLARSYVNMGYYYKCKGEYRNSINCFKENMAILKKIGDIGEMGAASSGMAGAYFNLSDYDNARAANYQYYESAIKMKSTFGLGLVWMLDTFSYTERGDFKSAEESGIKAYELAEKHRDTYMACMVGVSLGKVYIEKGDFQTAIVYLEKSLDLLEKNRFLKEYTISTFSYLAEAYILEYLSLKDQLPKKKSRILLRKVEKSCNEALFRTKLWATSHISSLRINGRYHNLTGNNHKAEKFFLDALKLSKKMERKYEQALTLYEYGRFLDRIGKTNESVSNFETAYNIFKKIGAAFYEKKMADLLGIEDTDSSSVERFTKELRYNQRLTSMLSLNQDISSILDLDELLEKIISIAMEVTGAQRGYLILKDELTGELTISVNKNVNVQDSEFGFSRNIINQVLKKGEHILTTNAAEDEKFHKFQSVVYNELKSVLCIPIKYKSEITGVCYLDNPLSSSVFTEEDTEILNTIMAQAAISIENAKLYKLAITDGLTELFTHKHFKYTLNRLIEQSTRYKHVLSLIMLDIDRFKNFNDTYGHQAGDHVLMKITKVIKEQMRVPDVVGRYGGEEFAVILPETDRVGAENTAERIRQAVQNTSIMYGDKELKVTVSLGVAEFSYHASDAESLISVADEAMYQSKADGRNRVTVARVKNLHEVS